VALPCSGLKPCAESGNLLQKYALGVKRLVEGFSLNLGFAVVGRNLALPGNAELDSGRRAKSSLQEDVCSGNLWRRSRQQVLVVVAGALGMPVGTFLYLQKEIVCASACRSGAYSLVEHTLVSRLADRESRIHSGRARLGLMSGRGPGCFAPSHFLAAKI
jgi:hypothetical protein